MTEYVAGFSTCTCDRGFALVAPSAVSTISKKLHNRGVCRHGSGAHSMAQGLSQAHGWTRLTLEFVLRVGVGAEL
jgi:hypothetical protein